VNIRKRIILFSILVIVVILGVLAIRHKYEQISDRFITHTNQVSQGITKEMKLTAQYLETLSQSSDFTDFLNDSNSVDKKKRAQKLFISTITRSPSYDQVRYIDETGYEVIRVNSRDNKVEIVPENFHQQKNNRYYFTDTMKLKKGEVYLSPLDLNIEQGKIEIPHVPTIRMSMPVFDTHGNKRGILIVNYRASEILNHLTAPDKLTDYVSTFLVNSDGYWIKGPSPESEWGFMFSDKQNEKFEKYFPLSNKIITDSDDGDLVNKEGVFFWVKFFPIEDIRPKYDTGNPHLFYYSRYLATKDFHLTIVAHSTIQQVVKYLFTFD
jgi:hypothetical protein